MGELTPLGKRYGIDLVNVDNSAFLLGTVNVRRRDPKCEVMYFPKKPSLFVFRNEIGDVIHRPGEVGDKCIYETASVGGGH